MKIIVEYQGKIYESLWDNEISAKEFAGKLYDQFEQFDRMQLKTKNGFILLGKGVIQNSIIRIEE